MKYILVVKLAANLKFYGPFDTVHDADRWAEENIQNGHSIVEIHSVQQSQTSPPRPPDAKRRDGGEPTATRSYRWDRIWKRSSE
jgi:hypothetical protein